MTPAFDTQAFIARMTLAGMPEPQAQALAETFAEQPAPIRKGAVIEAIHDSAVKLNKRIDASETRLAEKISVINENQLETNRALGAIMAHLGIAKPK